MDPNLSRWSDFVTSPIPDARAYCGMTIHAVYLLRLKPTMDLYHYFIRQCNVTQRFDRIILNLSIDVLIDGKIQYNPPGTPPTTRENLPAYASLQIRILYCFIQYLKYLYELSDTNVDIRMFRIDQYDDFRTNLYVYDHPIYEVKPKKLNIVFQQRISNVRSSSISLLILS